MKTEKRRLQLTEDHKQDIEKCHKKGKVFRTIARRMGKDSATISYETKKQRAEYGNVYSTLTEPCRELLKTPHMSNGCSRKGYVNGCRICFVYCTQKHKQEKRCCYRRKTTVFLFLFYSCKPSKKEINTTHKQDDFTVCS